MKKGVVSLKITDDHIIEMLFDRNEQALSETDRKYGTLCRKLAYSIIGDYEEAGECVNNSYFCLWNAIPPARPDSLKAYLCGIVRNVAVKIRRERENYSEKQTNFDELAEIFDDAQNIEELSDGEMLGMYINEFLSHQTKVKRKVFVMRYYYNFSIRDISDNLGIKESTVKTKLFRAREELKALLISKGYII